MTHLLKVRAAEANATEVAGRLLNAVNPMKKIALVAHDARKPVMVEWVGRNLDIFRQLELVATGTTGTVLLEHYPELRIERLESGPRGGDQQIGARIVSGAIDVLFFFIDPLTPMPHDVDVKALLRLSILYDVPLACSPRAAGILLESVRIAHAQRTGLPSASGRGAA